MDERGVEQYDLLDCVQIATDRAERGLVLRKAAVPGETILLLPSKSLFNVTTLDGVLSKELLPSPGNPSHPYHWLKGDVTEEEEEEANQEERHRLHLPLTSVQALTLALALWSNAHSNTKDFRSKWDAFLLSFPDNYSTFPVSWEIKSEDLSNQNHHLYKALLEALPNHVAELCKRVREKFQRDMDAIRSVEMQGKHLIDKEYLPDRGLGYTHLIWAWCSVNSRCVHIPLGLQRHLDNFTLAPLLDMANHTFDKRLECKVRWNPTGALQLSAPARSRNNDGLEAGQEVCITYGPHSNGTLLSEYGFIIPSSSSSDDSVDAIWNGNPYAEINIDHIIEAHLAKDTDYWGQRKVHMLQQHGYYGDYTIHPFPSPAHPSHRLVIALRLIAIKGSIGIPSARRSKKRRNSNSGSSVDDEMTRIQDWEEMLNGERHIVSSENETAVHDLLLNICDEVISVNKEKGTIYRQFEDKYRYPDYDDRNDAILQKNINLVIDLLDEEERIALMMKDAIHKGLADW